MERRSVLKGIAGGALATSSLAIPHLARAQGKKILIIASGQDIPNFDPHVATGYSAAMLLRNTYDSLTRVEGNPPKIVPHLAASWTISPDGLEYVFKLDTAARFQDGTPVTAEAVAYSFRRIAKLSKGNSWMVKGIVDPAGITALDVQTVRFKLQKPFAAFLSVLPWQFIVNPVLLETNKAADDGQEYLRKNTAGSGRFIVKRNEPGNLYELERVAKPWKAGGNLDGAIWKIVRETSSQRLMVTRGDAHIAVDLTSEDMDALKGKPGVTLILENEPRVFSIKMNTLHGPMADVNLRKAVAYAFNYQAMLDSAGYAQLMDGPLPVGLGHNPALKAARTDLVRAKQFLAKTKYPNGGVKLTMVHVTGLESQRQWSLVLLNSLKALNIELDIKPQVWPDMVASTKTPETFPDFFPVYQTANYADADNLAFASYHSANNGNWQNPVYKSAVADALIEKGRAEMDAKKRAAIYAEFERTIEADQPDIFGVLEKRKLALRDNVQNFVFTPVASNAIELLHLSLK